MRAQDLTWCRQQKLKWKEQAENKFIEDSVANWSTETKVPAIVHMLTVKDNKRTVRDRQASGVSGISTLRETL